MADPYFCQVYNRPKSTTGAPLKGPVAYNIYKGEQGQPKAMIVTGRKWHGYVAGGLPIGKTYCFEVTAVAQGRESDRSNEGCKTIPRVQP